MIGKAEKKDKMSRKAKIAMIGFTDQDNPFGDKTLSKKFVWKKKGEKESEEKVNEAEIHEEKLRRALESTGKAAKKASVQKMQAIERVRLLAKTTDTWKDTETEFLLRQAKERARIRIREGRPSPIDVLFKASIDDPIFSLSVWDVFSPSEIVASCLKMEEEQVKKTINDVEPFTTMEDGNIEYWTAVSTLLKSGLEEKKSLEGLDSSVKQDVKGILEGKTLEELGELEQQIQDQLQENEAVEEEYWDALAFQVKMQKSKIRADQVWEKVIEERKKRANPKTIENFQSNIKKKKARLDRDFHSLLPSNEKTKKNEVQKDENSKRRLKEKIAQQAVDNPWDNDIAPYRYDITETSAFLPEYFNIGEWMVIEQNRIGVNPSYRELHPHSRITPMWDLETRKEKKEGGKRTITPPFLNWEKRGRLRTHYTKNRSDDETDPERNLTVVGYKFALIYHKLKPDQKPTYVIRPVGAEKVIQFHAPPPYQDVAWRIKGGEIAKRKRAGYECTWKNGILRLTLPLKFGWYKK